MRWCLVTFACMLPGCLITDQMVEDLYLDRDGDGFRTSVIGGPDCDDLRAEVNPTRVELCGNGLDDDCDGWTDDDGVGSSTYWFDGDGDRFGDPERSVSACEAPPDHVDRAGDCNDGREDMHPGAEDICGNDIDEDCDDVVDNGGTLLTWYRDDDGDGWGRTNDTREQCDQPTGYVTHPEGDDRFDCDDRSGTVFPGAPETWYDGVDQDCDQGNDYDRDGDGFTTAAPEVTVPPGLASARPDCDDSRADVNPDAIEIPYDGTDDDCLPENDDDVDGDGFAADVVGGPDCDDTDPSVHPEAIEDPYDGVDQDCDATNEWDGDGDGQAIDPSTADNLALLAGRTVPPGAAGADCHDGEPSWFLGAPEVCDHGLDQNCDGDTSDEWDCDADGFTLLGAPLGSSDDCDDERADVHPGVEDAPYDGLDADCDGWSDFDADRDGHDSEGYGGEDCDDDAPSRYPFAPEVCWDLDDDDCDGGFTCLESLSGPLDGVSQHLHVPRYELGLSPPWPSWFQASAYWLGTRLVEDPSALDEHGRPELHLLTFSADGRRLQVMGDMTLDWSPSNQLALCDVDGDAFPDLALRTGNEVDLFLGSQFIATSYPGETRTGPLRRLDAAATILLDASLTGSELHLGTTTHLGCTGGPRADSLVVLVEEEQGVDQVRHLVVRVDDVADLLGSPAPHPIGSLTVAYAASAPRGADSSLTLAPSTAKQADLLIALRDPSLTPAVQSAHRLDLRSLDPATPWDDAAIGSWEGPSRVVVPSSGAGPHGFFAWDGSPEDPVTRFFDEGGAAEFPFREAFAWQLALGEHRTGIRVLAMHTLGPPSEIRVYGHPFDGARPGERLATLTLSQQPTLSHTELLILPDDTLLHLTESDGIDLYRLELPID